MGYHNRVSSYDYNEKLDSKFSIVRTSTYGEDNKFFFSSSTFIIGVKSTGSMHCRLVDTITNLTPGDVIDVSFDVRFISGVKPKVAFREYNGSGSPFDMHVYSTDSDGEWVTQSFKYVFRNLNNSQKLDFNIGLYTGDVGQFELRNIRVCTQSKRNYQRPFEFKPYEINKTAGAFAIRTDFTNAGGTLTTLDANTLRLTFSTSFKNRPVVTLGEDYIGSANLYNVRVGNLTVDYVDIKFFDLSGVAVPVANIPDTFHFGICVFGWQVV